MTSKMILESIFTVAFLLHLPKTIFGDAGPDFKAQSKISPDLFTKLEKGESINILVSFTDGTKQALDEVPSLRISDRGQKAQAVYNSLLANAEKSQAGVETLLESTSRSAGTHFKKFWISNQVWVKDADLKTVRMLAEEDPQVANVKEEPVAHLIRGEDTESVGQKGPPPPEGTIQWNIKRVQAPEAWEEIGGKGEGVVVGFIDSGVSLTHETLRDNFLGDYGWLDGIYGKPEPYDDSTHGTHVTGIAVGSKGIGVAPGAKWAACHACDIVNCRTKALLDCGEFFVCPTLVNGTNRDCSKAPHIISNSWGGPGEDYDGIIAAWRSAGIIPVFAIGNGPPSGCKTATYPGRHRDVIGVGNVNMENTTDDTLSQKGPTEDGRIKPDLAAPGISIYSAIGDTIGNLPDNEYAHKHGTSMACPHVAGVIALLLSRDTSLTYEQVKDYLFKNSDQESMKEPVRLDPPVWRCGTVINGTMVWPNNHYGYGLVNAYAAVKAQTLNMMGNKTM